MCVYRLTYNKEQVLVPLSGALDTWTHLCEHSCARRILISQLVVKGTIHTCGGHESHIKYLLFTCRPHDILSNIKKKHSMYGISAHFHTFLVLCHLYILKGLNNIYIYNIYLNSSCHDFNSCTIIWKSCRKVCSLNPVSHCIIMMCFEGNYESAWLPHAFTGGI